MQVSNLTTFDNCIFIMLPMTFGRWPKPKNGWQIIKQSCFDFTICLSPSLQISLKMISVKFPDLKPNFETSPNKISKSDNTSHPRGRSWACQTKKVYEVFCQSSSFTFRTKWIPVGKVK